MRSCLSTPNFQPVRAPTISADIQCHCWGDHWSPVAQHTPQQTQPQQRAATSRPYKYWNMHEHQLNKHPHYILQNKNIMLKYHYALVN